MDIQDRVHTHYEALESCSYNVFATVLHGSQNYGLDLCGDYYCSDVDTRSIVLPSFDDIAKGNLTISSTHIMENDEHADIKDIWSMVNIFKKQNLNFMEFLFSEYYFVNPLFLPEFKALQDLGESLTHCHPAQALRTMSGQVESKLKALEHSSPASAEKIAKYGYDGKQLHHIIRIYEFMKNYVAGMPYKDCLITHDSLLYEMMIKAKLNHFSLEEARHLANYYGSKDGECEKLRKQAVEQYGEDVIDQLPYIALLDLEVEITKKWIKHTLRSSHD